jgi:hypothetical protein
MGLLLIRWVLVSTMEQIFDQWGSEARCREKPRRGGSRVEQGSRSEGSDQDKSRE